MQASSRRDDFRKLPRGYWKTDYPRTGGYPLVKTWLHANKPSSRQRNEKRYDRNVEYVHGILKRSLNVAVKWGLLIKNPATLVAPPKMEFKVPKTWSQAQVKRFLEVIKDDRWAALFILAAGTGMRKAEVLGLPLSALDLDKGYLMVVQSLQYLPKRGLFNTGPKTPKSRRMIVLPDFVKEALRIHLAR